MLEGITENSESLRTFHFTDETDLIMLSCSSSEDSNNLDTDVHTCKQQCLNVTVAEVLDPHYGMYVWPCAPILAQYIWYRRNVVKGKTVLELGAGTSLPSVVCAKCGASVIVSDAENLHETLQCARKNMELNSISPEHYDIMEISWGTFSPSLLRLKPVDIIIGSDVFYEPEEFEDVLMTVSYLLNKNVHAEFWCSYQERSADWNIEYLLKKWSLCYEEVPLDTFGILDSSYASWKIPRFQKLCLFIFKGQKQCI